MHNEKMLSKWLDSKDQVDALSRFYFIFEL